MRSFMAVVRALADENRVRALLALRDCELCACQIIELLGLANSTVSKHMSILKQARLVDSRKDGRWVYYHLTGEEVPTEVREAITWVCKSLTKDPEIQKDAEILKEILKLDPEKLCKKQNNN